jgi:hypothetical protein
MVRDMTEAQETTLKRMPSHDVVTYLQTGAIVIAMKARRSGWMVVDTDGNVYDFHLYFSRITQHA